MRYMNAFSINVNQTNVSKKIMTEKVLHCFLPENEYGAQKSHNSLYSNYTYFTYHPKRKL